MSSHRSITRAALWLSITLLTIAACSATSYLKVTYQLPGADAPSGPSGKTVFLKITDGTGGSAFIGPHASDDLKGFSGLFSVYVAGGQPTPMLEGAYDIQGLFDVAFRQRLTAAGVTLAKAPAATVPTLQVDITSFKIDMAGRTWTTRLDYLASMRLAAEALTTQKVSGTAERAKIVGTREAETLLGEIVTDMVNRLDLDALFRHPQL